MTKEFSTIINKIKSTEHDIQLIDQGSLNVFESINQEDVKRQLRRKTAKFCMEEISNIIRKLYDSNNTDEQYGLFKEFFVANSEGVPSETTEIPAKNLRLKKQKTSTKNKEQKRTHTPILTEATKKYLRSMHDKKNNLEYGIFEFLFNQSAYVLPNESNVDIRKKLIPITVISKNLNRKEWEIQRAITNLKNKGYIYSESRRGGGYCLINI